MEQPRFAHRVSNMSGSIIREILKLAEQSQIISFAGGFPSPDSFPVDLVRKLTSELLKKNGPEILQYSSSEGYPPFRQYVADTLTRQGMPSEADDVLIISGSQQAIDFTAKAFIDPGDTVLVESPTYLAALNVFRSYEANLVGIPSDENGVDIDALEKAASAGKAKLVYLVTTFANPTGRTLSLERRKKLVDILEKYQLVMLEDDPYGRLRYSGEPLPTVKSLDPHGNVIYSASFSKLISPGMRVGYVTARPDILRKLVLGKQCTDVHTNNLGQRIVYEFCRRGLLEPHIEKIKKAYREKRDCMLQLCERHFPQGTTWSVPEGGLFLWVTLPEGISATELLPIAIEREHVAFIPGQPFFADGSGTNTMRLNFSNASLQQINEGMRRLGGVVQEAMKQPLTA